ncbi:MAG TPA: serine hydrolase domain-containing protein [Gemmatimonadales bacterium]|nr:serine hydrolase domain-containing protein [Gemmatimonadales bacterium]
MWLLRLPGLAALLACAAPLAAQQPAAAAARVESAIDRARTFIRDSIEKVGIPGVSITVMREGQILWSEGIGWADLEQRVPVTPLTRFRVGSVSKPLTAAAVGLLVEAGKLDLDAPVQRYVPGFPEKRYPVTTRMAAGHLAGIRHYQGDEFLSTRRYATVAEGLTIFRDDTLLFRPGTRFLYSSYAWNLVSAVIEGASGEPFLAYMRNAVFRPLGMRQTVPDHVDSIVPFRARWYSVDSVSGIVNAPYVDNSYKWAGGGFLSTTEDLARFGQAMLDNALLRAETFRLLTTSQRTQSGEETDYGIGWGIRRDDKGRLALGHSGGSAGGTAYLVLYPAEQLVVAVLANGDSPFVGATPRIAAMFLD